MERYFLFYPEDSGKAINLSIYNLQLSETLYTSLSCFEVTLRNALARELKVMTGKEDGYTTFSDNPSLVGLSRYTTQAMKQISSRHESISPSKVIAELTLGFWVSLLNSEYEKVLWKDLRRAFPYIPKAKKKRKNLSGPLNRFRRLRNRVFHNEPICWNLKRLIDLHSEMIKVLGWIDCKMPYWIANIDRFPEVSSHVYRDLVIK